MARPPKKGIDYAGWSVDIFDNDTKIDKLLDAHGWDGFGIYFYLCQRAYGGEGYFYKWGYADCATTARKMGGGIGSGTVKETVGYCLQIGLFDKGLFDRWEVLTSRGIQMRYCEAIKNRRTKEVIAEYWLLQKEEDCDGLVKIPINTSLQTTNPSLQGTNPSLREANGGYESPKESKVKESKVKESNTPLNPPTGKRETNADITRRLFQKFLPEYDFSETLTDSLTEWFEYKIERKEYYISERGMKCTLSRFRNLKNEHGEVALIEAIEYSMGNSYKGVFFENKKSQSGSSYINQIKNRVSEVDDW